MKRPMFILALILAIMALAALVLALEFPRRPLYFRTSFAGPIQIPPSGHGASYGRLFPYFYFSGLLFAACSFVLSIASLCRKEQGAVELSLLLVLVYVVLHFIFE